MIGLPVDWLTGVVVSPVPKNEGPGAPSFVGQFWIIRPCSLRGESYQPRT
jgi:hypothetical protein